MKPADIKLLLESRYDRANWQKLLHALFPGCTELWSAAAKLPLADDFPEAVQFGRILLADGRRIALLEVPVSGHIDLQRNRVGLRNLVAKAIDGESAHAVFGLFIDRATGDYRFSFAARTHEIGADGDFSTRETAPRRYTYLLGPGRSCRTATERFAALGALGAEATLAAITKAFSVEPLFKEFYKDYRAAFEAVEKAVAPSIAGHDAKRKSECLRLFTQRLFNRLMFLAFIERKHWLRFGHRTADYLAALYDHHRNAAGEHANFYRDRLVPLFFEGLNRPDRDPTVADPRFGAVPYLNGGLFEKADDGVDDLPGLVVPDDALARILDPEVGLFSRYNFTVAESTPLEVEVAVDPEMLGKVFEELVTGRHEQGSYYTPKPIVSFMARAALVEHLADRCPKESRAALESFVHDHRADGLKNHEAVLAALRAVTTCDPACGSGAYLLGMLHELLDLRTALVALAPAAKLDAATAYERKLEIISRNLYGVDLDPFAVNIARLRLWLSLIVEFEGATPPPLPNLDFKIECGDSLAAPAPADAFADAMDQGDTVHTLAAKKSAYLRAHGAEKEKLRADIAALKKNLLGWVKVDKDTTKAFHWAVEFAEVFFPTPAGTAITGELNLGLALAAAPTPGGFDIVVANPPYVRMELIKPIKPMLKKRFAAVHAERADLFVYFYARAHELLRPNGVAAFISSNKWLRAGYGESLRQLLLDQQAFRLVMDFGELGVFDTAATDAAIFLWQKQTREKFVTRWAMVKDLAQCYRDGVRNHFEQLAVSVPAENFGEGKPRLATVATAHLKNTMESQGEQLGLIYKGKLGWGIKTGLNEAFIISQEIRDKLVAEHESAAKIIKPLLVGDNIRKYERHYRGLHLIYTEHGINIKAYPSVENWLKGFINLPAKKGGEPRGLVHRATKQEWHELQQPQKAYEPLFIGPKICYPDIGKECRFLLDETGMYVEATAFVIGGGDYFLLGLLNSSSAFNYFQELCAVLGDKEDGGRLRFKTQYIEKLPIPDATPADRKLIGDLAKRAQELHTERRALVEQFLRDLGIDPAASNSRSVLESPWTLAETEFVKRAKKKPLKLYHEARDATGALTERIAAVEAEIDRRVAVLYGLAPDTTAPASNAPAKGEEKEALFFKLLGELKARSPYFTLDAIRAAASDAGLTLKDASLKVYLTEAVKLGRVHDAGRGWYSGLATRATLDPHPVAKLIRTIEKAFPLLDFTVWSTVQMNPWMHHLLAKPIHFLNAPAETLESIAEALREQGWDVAVNPPPSQAARQVRPGEKGVVLRPALARAPHPTGRQAAMEAIFVDWLVESASIGFVSSDEAHAALTSIAETCLLEVSSIHRYAESRKVDLLKLDRLTFVIECAAVTKVNDI